MSLSTLAEAFENAWLLGFEAQDPITVDEWAQRYRVLEIGAEAGLRWNNDRTPYLVGPMRALSPDDPHKNVVLQMAAQLGKTAMALNWLGHSMHVSPAPILVAYPTREGAQAFVRQRFDPMVAETSVLNERVADARSRDRGNTLQNKKFLGGAIGFRGANSPAALRGFPAKRLFLDEIDNFPGELEQEGDPLQLAITRTTSYPDSKRCFTSTPTYRGLSKVEKLFLKSDRRRYFLTCPECGHPDYLTWKGIDIYGDEKVAHHRIVWTDHRPETAAMACSKCGCVIEERFKAEMLARGEWRPTAPGDGETAGFHLSSLYAPDRWISWSDHVKEFLDAGDDQSKLKPFVQLRLAETWKDDGIDASPDDLLERAKNEHYNAEIPFGVGVLTLAIDMHPDRAEWQVVGWGDREESWAIAKNVILGDPGASLLSGEMGARIDEQIAKYWQHESGQLVPVSCTVIDSGGHHTDEVYQFCAARWRSRVWAVRGGGQTNRDIITKPSKNSYGGVVWTLGVQTAKDTIMSRLRTGSPGPGYMHLPSHLVTKEYVLQLTAERAQFVLRKGRGWIREWKPTRKRNEILDLWVYGLAALHICGYDPSTGSWQFIRSLGERAAKLAERVDGETPKKPEPLPQETVQARLLRLARERAQRMRRTGRKRW